MSRLLLCTRKGLFVIEGQGAGAAITGTAFLGDNVPLALCDPRDGSLYAVLDHGHFGVKLHRSPNGGRSWEEIAVATYPPKPEGLVDRDMWGREREWATKNIWALEVAPDSEGGLWCGTLPGGLFRSDDRGATWRLIDSLWNHPCRLKWNGGGADHAALHSICVDPRDPSTVVVGVSCGGVWRSRDRGATWAPTAPLPGSAYAIWGSGPDEVYAVGGGDAQHPAQRLDHRWFAEKRGDTARRIAARLDLAAVGIEDAHLHIGACRGFEQDKLVASDAEAAVGDRMRARRGHLDGTLARVDQRACLQSPFKQSWKPFDGK